MENNNQNNTPSIIPAIPSSNESPQLRPKNTLKVVIALVYILVLYFGINLLWFVGLNFLVGLPYFGILVINSIFAITDLYFKDRFSYGYVYIAYIVLIVLMSLLGSIGVSNTSLFPSLLLAQ